MKKALIVIGGRLKAVRGAVAVALAAGAASAHAALPAVVGTTLTEIETDGTALADLVWPIMLGFLGLSILMKLSKRFGNKV